MRQVMRDLRRHRVSALAFLALWAAFWAWVLAARITGVDLDLTPILIYPALPLVAGALIGWWRWWPVGEPGSASTIGEALRGLAASLPPGLGTALAVGAAITALPAAIGLVDAWQQLQANQGTILPPPPFSDSVGGMVKWVVVPGLVNALIGCACASLIRTWLEGRGGRSPRREKTGADLGADPGSAGTLPGTGQQ